MPSDRGFASLKKKNPKRQREIAGSGGREAHRRGTAHKFTSAEGKAAGRIGGLNRWKNKANALS